MTTDVDGMLHRYVELLNIARDDVEHEDWLPRSMYNKKSLAWAYGHYCSRRYPGKYSAFGSAVDKRSTDGRETMLGELGILVPALDILNHGDSSVEWLRLNTTDAGHLQVITMQPRKKGQQLWSNYCSISNERLLFAYGFAIENNDNDEVALHLKLGTKTGDVMDIVDHGVFRVGRGGCAGVPPELWAALKSLREEDDNDEED